MPWLNSKIRTPAKASIEITIASKWMSFLRLSLHHKLPAIKLITIARSELNNLNKNKESSFDRIHGAIAKKIKSDKPK